MRTVVQPRTHLMLRRPPPGPRAARPEDQASRPSRSTRGRVMSRLLIRHARPLELGQRARHGNDELKGSVLYR
jgi:hypothetical protein